MSLRIAVFDPLPLLRRGIMATLEEAGLTSETPQDVLTWITDDTQRLILLTLHSAEDWRLLTRLRDFSGDVLVVAMLADDNVATYVRALSSGAIAALPRNSEPAAVRAAVEAVVDGRTILPLYVLRTLTSASTPSEINATAPSPRELEWLGQLATGMTVAEVASGAGYSERMMFRLLRDVYRRMRVKDRTEALLLARERGWL